VTASVTDAVTADDARVRDALRRSLIARIATVTPSGGPLIMPLYFVVLDGRIYMNNAATSPTVKNIAVHPQALVLFAGRDGAVVRVRGAARFVHDAALMKRVVRASVPKYFFPPRALWLWISRPSRLRARSTYTSERTDTGLIEVTPEWFAVGTA
jgi:general stress protein 26